MRTLHTVSRDYSDLMSLEDAKTWLRVEGTDDDSVIAAMMSGVFTYAENYLNATVGSNVYVQTQDTFDETEYIKLMRPPVDSITKIEYVDLDGTTQEVDSSLYKLNKDQGYIYLKAGEKWPEIADEPFAVKIYYVCTGMFINNEADDILDAIKMMLTYRYDYRDDVNQRWRKASDAILDQLRNKSF